MVTITVQTVGMRMAVVIIVWPKNKKTKTFLIHNNNSYIQKLIEPVHKRFDQLVL